MKKIICGWRSTLLLVWLCWPATAGAQQGGIGDALSALTNAGIIRGLVRNEPITTNIRDVNKRVELPDSFGDNQTFRPLHRRSRTATGGWELTPGFYELRSRSYCIRAGTHAPSHGDGYLYAPLKGRQADIVQAILTGSATHHEIAQSDVQLLLWAIIARSDFSSMNSQTIGVATTLLTPSQLVRLNKQTIINLARGLINSPQLEASLRPIFAAEYELRQAFGQMNARFEDVERLAMLAGPALVDNPDIRRGRWSKHPDGYYVRYFPNGYSRTVIQVYVPDEVHTVSFNATDDVAVPANTGAQRLALSNVPYDTTGYAPELPSTVARQQPVEPAISVNTPAPAKSETPPIPRSRPTVQYQQVCGLVTDSRTHARISRAVITLGDREIMANERGIFVLDSLVVGKTIGVTAPAPKYMTNMLDVDVKQQSGCQSILIELTPQSSTSSGRVVALDEPEVRAGDRIILENIQFEQSRSELLSAGKIELDKVVVWMKGHPTAHIELSGHTSNEGERAANLVLSKERAATCKTYLLRKGINPNLIKSTGYGQERPIVPNDTPERAKNRRVELKVEQL